MSKEVASKSKAQAMNKEQTMNKEQAMGQEHAQGAPPQPTREHARLMDMVGTWTVDCEFNMGPGQPLMKVQARDVCEAFGPFWVQSTFECDMFGAPYRGRGTNGFDPSSQEYICTWIDTMSPSHFLLKGKADASGKVIESRGHGFDCMSGRMTDFRSREQVKSKDERVFEMFMTLPDGSEFKMFTHRYRRAKS